MSVEWLEDKTLSTKIVQKNSLSVCQYGCHFKYIMHTLLSSIIKSLKVKNSDVVSKKQDN